PDARDGSAKVGGDSYKYSGCFLLCCPFVMHGARVARFRITAEGYTSTRSSRLDVPSTRSCSFRIVNPQGEKTGKGDSVHDEVLQVDRAHPLAALRGCARSATNLPCRASRRRLLPTLSRRSSPRSRRACFPLRNSTRINRRL